VRTVRGNGLPIKPGLWRNLAHPLGGASGRRNIQGFRAELRLKPWQPPRILLPLLLSWFAMALLATNV